VDEVEALVSERRRSRQEKAAGFCAKCGKPVLKSDKFCPRCGTTI
jgi:predicted amidophosphoribosyltransferase